MIDRSNRDPSFYDTWFGRVRREFAAATRGFAGRAIIYVEIGCWAGASAEWACRNLLADPDSCGVGIDPYGPDRKHGNDEIERVRQSAIKRVAATGAQWEWLQTPSATALRGPLQSLLNGRAIDIIYIDGCHDADAVLTDFILAWPLLRAGSVVIFDDVGRTPCRHGGPHVREAVEAVALCWGRKLERLPGRRQAAFRVNEKQGI